LRKGQADIISVLLIFLISLGLVATILYFVIPYLGRSNDLTKLKSVSDLFNPDPQFSGSIVNVIKKVVSQGSEETITLPPNVIGKWELVCDDPSDPYNFSKNYVQLTVPLSATDVPLDCSNPSIGCGWIPVNTFNNQTTATLGIDNAAVVYERADKVGSGYNVTFRAWFRQLNISDYDYNKNSLAMKDSSLNPPKNCTAENPIRSTSSSIRISKGSDISSTFLGRTLLLTQVKFVI